MSTGMQLWNPDWWRFGRELGTLQREMDRLFGDFSERFPRLSSRRDVDYVPACDLQETEGHYQVTLDIPGLKKEDVRVELAGSLLTVSGEHKEDKTEKQQGWRVSERCQGRFERRFSLPESDDMAKVEATYSDGVLYITIPKTAAAKTKLIPIWEGKPTAKAKIEEEKTGRHKSAAA